VIETKFEFGNSNIGKIIYKPHGLFFSDALYPSLSDSKIKISLFFHLLQI
jgi:hypothetical protein